MSSSLPYVSAAEVHAALDYPSLVERLRAAFAAGATSPVRHGHVIGEASQDRLLLMPAWRAGQSIGVKIVTVFPDNAKRDAATVGATYVLLDGATGHARAVLDGEALTLRRTGAASALAASYLARSDSRVLLAVGAGQLAPHLIHAHRAVRPIERVLVWARREAQAEALASTLRDAGIDAASVATLEEGLAAADIVTCATTSNAPLVLGAVVRPGTHVDLVGGFTPLMREADDDLIALARVYVDTFAGALAEAGDLTQPIAAGRITREHVVAELAMLARGEAKGRTHRDEITVFKSVGTALEDLAAAELTMARVSESAPNVRPQ
jgi:ornithine cyclodeaminase/alanine dehydrogenase-like protein (mu-crystallin family)